jgi:hypothetical protein
LGIYFNFLFLNEGNPPPTVKLADAYDAGSPKTETTTLAEAIAKFSMANESDFLLATGWNGITAYEKQAGDLVNMGPLAGNWEGDDEDLAGLPTCLRITGNLLSVFMGGITETLLTYSGKIVEATDVTANTGYIYIRFPGFTGTTQDYDYIGADEDDYYALYWSKTGDGYKFSVWNADDDNELTAFGSDLATLKALRYENGDFGDVDEDPEDGAGIFSTGIYVGFTRTSW